MGGMYGDPPLRLLTTKLDYTSVNGPIATFHNPKSSVRDLADL
jgi:hypothetical protein